MKNLKDSLIADPSQTHELEEFLSSYLLDALGKFEGKGDIQKKQMVYSDSRGDFLTVQYDKKRKGEIQAIFVNKERLDIPALIDEANAALRHDLGPGVARSVMMCSVPVEGWYKCRDEFQIYPVPAEAARPRGFADEGPVMLIGDHPFFLEHKFEKSPDRSVNNYRITRRNRELVLLLNLVLRESIKSAESASWVWVRLPKENHPTSKRDNRYLPLGYHLPGNAEERERDSLGYAVGSDCPPLNITSQEEYYDFGQNCAIDFDLVLPASIDRSISAFDALKKSPKEKLLRSAYWITVAQNILSISQSAAFTALVNAVEVFLPEDKKRCPKCKQPVHESGIQLEICEECDQPEPGSGPTKHFRDFVEEFAPEVPRSLRNKLYSLRSKLVHGRVLMHYDGAALGSLDGQFGDGARGEFNVLSYTVRKTLVNWLFSTQETSG